MKIAPPKYKPLIALSAFLLSAAGLHAQAFTSPVGYVTHTLRAGQFNLVGLTVHNPIEITGDFESVSGTTLVDNEASFNTVLTAGSTYILEITSGDLAGTIQEIEWTANGSATTLVTSDNLGSDGLSAADTYQIRRAATFEDIFGANNNAGLRASASASGSAVIWVQDAASSIGFSRYYYNTGGFGLAATWKRIESSGGDVDVTAASVVLPYVDAVFIQMPSGADDEVVFTGAVKTSDTTIALDRTFNYISTSFPVNATLENSGLLNDISTGASAASADIVWIPNGLGAYDRYYFNTGGFGVAPTWRSIGPGGAETSVDGDVELTSGIIIQKNGSDINVTLNPAYDL